MARRADVEAALSRLAPSLPPFEHGVVVDRAMDSRGLSTARPETAAWLALTSFVRHALTDYDDLLDEGFDVESARHFVAAEMDEILAGWGVRRSVSEGEDTDEEADGDEMADGPA